jgi:hypothetical protein
MDTVTISREVAERALDIWECERRHGTFGYARSVVDDSIAALRTALAQPQGGSGWIYTATQLPDPKQHPHGVLVWWASYGRALVCSWVPEQKVWYGEGKWFDAEQGYAWTELPPPSPGTAQ